MNTAFVYLSMLLELTCAYVYIRDALNPQRSLLQRAVSWLWGFVFGSIGLVIAYYLLFA